MSIKAIEAAIALKLPSSGMKLVLIVLANSQNQYDDYCWPAQERLADDASMSIRAVRDNLVRLEKDRLIESKIVRAPDGKYVRTEYRLLFLPPADSAARPPADSSVATGRFFQKPPADSAGISINRNIEPEEEPEGEGKPAAKSAAGRQSRTLDTAIEIFRERYDAQMAPDKFGAGQTKDFVQLAALKRRLGLSNGHPPPEWSRVVDNFFASDFADYGLAFCCSKYGMLLKGPVDRFGRLKQSKGETQNGDESPAQAQARRNRERAHEVHSELFAKTRSPYEGGPE